MIPAPARSFWPWCRTASSRRPSIPVYVTRTESFNAGHRLFNPEFSDERNRDVFGKCSNPSGHGHNYTLEVTVSGEVDPQTGYVMDLKVLAGVIRERIIDQVDHRNLNVDVDWLHHRIPTAEVLACAFWDRLEGHLPQGSLWKVVVHETDKNRAERRRES